MFLFSRAKNVIDVMHRHVNVNTARQECIGGSKKLKLSPGSRLSSGRVR